MQFRRGLWLTLRVIALIICGLATAYYSIVSVIAIGLVLSGQLGMRAILTTVLPCLVFLASAWWLLRGLRNEI
jgi:lipopolysaccharide export LptBFGC system permease protein LptF